MTELKRSIEGFWWNPSEPEKKYFGTLKYFEDIVRLDIVFSVEQLHSCEQEEFLKHFTNDALPIIHGYTGGNSRKKYTLINVTIKSNEYPNFYIFSFGKLPIYVESVLEGILLESISDDFIAQAYICFDELSEWVPPPYIKETYIQDEELYCLKYSGKESKKLLFKDDKLQLFITAYLSGTKSLGNNYSYTIFNDAKLYFNCNKKINLQNFNNYVFSIKSFLWLCTGKCHNISDIQLCYLEKNKNEIPSKTWFKKSIVEDRRTKCILKYENIFNLEQIYLKWVCFLNENKSTIRMLLQILERPSTYFDDRKTENLVQIFEALSDSVFGENIAIDEKYFKSLVTDQRALKNFEKNKTSPVLLSKLAYFFWEREFLNFIEDFNYIYGDHDVETIKKFLINAKEIRVKYSHGGKENKDKKIELRPECINVLLYKGIRLMLFKYILKLKNINIEIEPI